MYTTAQQKSGKAGALRKAGNGRDQVNVISWSKQPEIAQLSNFAEVSMTLEFLTSDLEALGFTAREVDAACPQGNPLRVHCGSVEGFVQSLKAASLDEQTRIAQLHGKSAKHAGSEQMPEIEAGKRVCFFRSLRFDYVVPEHRALIEYAIWQKFAQDANSQAAMRWTGDARLTHNLGKFDAKKGKTSLPKQVFTRILDDCRTMIEDEAPAKSFAEILECARKDTLDELQWY